MSDFELDLRQLPPPQPLLRILDRLEGFAAGDRLRALTPCHPVPLLELLEARGLAYEVEDVADGATRISIRHRDDGAGD